ncbi:MAG: DUF1540 domain-containing protein [Chloroflexi bacterium]|nr:DUF1540 domain-containing protein [Chloroflexota bacterium]
MNGMPPVTRCEVNECFYNRDQQCHAPAIDVGNASPDCDAYIPQPTHTHRAETGLVGACHINGCRWNSELMCSASGIVVAHHGKHAECDTFEPAT